VHSIQELSALDFARSSLLHEGFSKRVVATDEELVPSAEPFEKPEAWHKVRLPADATVAASTRQHQVPDPINKRASAGCQERMREEVVNIWW
jgi:hypothetical protein